MKQYATKALRLIKNLFGGVKGMLHNLWLRNRNRRLYNSDLLMRTYKVDIPKSTKIKGKVHLIAVKGASIKLGENVTLRSDPFDYLGGMPFGTTLLVDKSEAEIIIGDNCRLNGTYVHSKKRIRIGNNCVIAANSVVKGIFPPNSLIQGNPAVVKSILPIES